jgi:hypothetical protein
MNTTLDRYNNGFDPNAVKDINEINEKIKKEQNPEELTKLLMQRMCRGFDINAGATGRVKCGYYPY